MTHLRGVRLRNYACFRGEHEIALKPLTYAVVARDQRNHERSNWLGKSTFLGAIRFALTGQHDGGKTADAWVTRGETEGGVDLELDDGTYLSRGRAAKGATQLLVIPPDGRELRQLDAEHWIARHLLDPETWDLSYHIRQGATSRLLDMGASERTEVVGGWAGLDRLDRALDLIADRDDAEVVRVNRLTGELALLDTKHSPEELAVEVARLEGELAVAAEALEVERQREKIRADWLASKRQAAQLAQQKVALKEAEKLAAGIPGVERELASTTADLMRLRDWRQQKAAEVARLKVLAAGEFDGRCPVQQGLGCPARDAINAKRGENSRAYEKAAREAREAPEAVALQAQQRRAEELAEESKRLRGAERDVAVLRRIIEAADDRGPAWRDEPPEPEVERAMRDYNAAVERLGVARNELKRAERARARRVAIAGELDEIAERRKLLRGAAIVYGRNGAQRRLIEGVIGAIRDRSNAALERAGVELQIAVSWGREGKKLERVCSVCGHGYGNSQAAKKCGACGAERAKTFDPRLDIQLSSESGGARDIAGLLLQLSAARWLRGVRRMPWATYLIDEPFGAVDRANRLALAARLHSVMHREFGSEQALIVAHDADTLNALPGRIEITSDGRHSQVRVV